jgi:thiol-disulfide isomerase/thioredoxin
MKLYLFLIISCFTCYSYGQESNGFVIQGIIRGLKDKTLIYLVHYSSDQRIDTLQHKISKNGYFRFKGMVPIEAEFYRIIIDSNKKSIPILLDNSKIRIEVSLKDDWTDITIFKVKITGSKSQDDFSNFEKQFYIVNEEKKIMLEKYNDMKAKGVNPENIYNDLVILNSKIYKLKKQWVLDHPKSFYSPYVIDNIISNVEEQDSAYKKLDENSKESYYGILLKKNIDNAKLRATIKVGNLAPNFSSITPDGLTLTLKEVVDKGKLTLIDFWASWCVPCRKEVGNLRKVYNAFHSKGFNILSVAFDEKRKNWMDAITKDSMTWFQVSQLKFRLEDAGVIYGINGIPASILLDKEGRIVAIDASGSAIFNAADEGTLRGDALYRKIEKILN